MLEANPPVTSYPQYEIDFDQRAMEMIVDMTERLLVETGMDVPCEKFLERIKGRKGYTLRGGRVFFDRDLVKTHIEEQILKQAERRGKSATTAAPSPSEWHINSGGYSLDVIDLDTDEIRPATVKDLAELTRLADSYGMSGSNVVQPQDVRPMMRDIASCRGSFENGRNFITNCHSHPDQTPYLIDMFNVVDKPFPVLIITAPPLHMAPENLEEFLYVYDNHREDIERKRIIISQKIYNSPGIGGPITVAGNMALSFAESLGAHILFDLFDERIDLPVNAGNTGPTDMRYANYAFGSPRTHLFAYLGSRWMDCLAGVSGGSYQPGSAALWTSSSRMDEQAGLEKMACGLTAALQGARSFVGAGNLCVDDLIGGAQMVLDVEMMNYIRELVESFNPDKIIASMDGVHEAILDVVNGNDIFLSHETTAGAFRRITPSSDIFHREKLRSWLSHRTTARDRARAVAKERIAKHDFRLTDGQLQELERIYTRADKGLAS